MSRRARSTAAAPFSAWYAANVQAAPAPPGDPDALRVVVALWMSDHNLRAEGPAGAGHIVALGVAMLRAAGIGRPAPGSALELGLAMAHAHGMYLDTTMQGGWPTA
jgi:hypothetical protein